MMPKANKPDEVGLALSGGGFRATLFHVGSLWRLNELGWLPKIHRYCSVSGGSITAGLLALKWNELAFNSIGRSPYFEGLIAKPLMRFCSTGIDFAAGLEGLLSFDKSISDTVTAKYRERLFGDATLQDLPRGMDKPRFIFYATNLQTGSSVRLSQPYIGDYKLGLVSLPKLSLAQTVAASSAFPPVLSPVVLNFGDAEWTRTEGAYEYDQVALRTKVYLTDGGVYDNLGLEGIWDRCGTVLVSDAGAPLDIDAAQSWAWHDQALRAFDIVTEQTRALRKRRLVQDFKDGVRKGTYWGIRTQIDDYGLGNALTRDNATTSKLCGIRTRLNTFSKKEQGQLINWGYALTDAAMRRHLSAPASPVPVWPIPDSPL